MSLSNRLFSLKLLLDAKKLNFRNIWKKIDELSKYEELTEYDYLQYLLYPESYKFVKVPSKVPIWSTCFHLRKNKDISVNANGCLLFYFNPFFLKSGNVYGQPVKFTYDKNGLPLEYIGWAVTYGTFWITTNDALDGINEMDKTKIFAPIDMDQTVPPMYTSYRLVSGSVSIRYNGNMLDASGVVGGGICLQDYQILAGRSKEYEGDFDPSVITKVLYGPFHEFTVFDNIRHLPGSKENNCLEGIRLLYYPIDNSYKEFVKLYDGTLTTFSIPPDSINGNVKCSVEKDLLRGGFGWLGYVYNATPGTKFMITIDLNYECLLDSEYIDYIPSSLITYDMSQIQENNIIEKIRVNAIQKLNK